ncbi:MAG TPA: peptidase P60, partial [Rhodobiaceae bacterium]|nr:peptidase P60 [Rhodobiaceae bacterium]
TPPAYTATWAEVPGGHAEEMMVQAARRHMEEIGCSAARAGDIMLFRMRANGPAKHAAILSADNRMIHAWSGRAVVETVMGRWWRARAAHAFRFPGLED